MLLDKFQMIANCSGGSNVLHMLIGVFTVAANAASAAADADISDQISLFGTLPFPFLFLPSTRW